MKDIILLIRQRKEFYLTVLVITLLLTIIGAVYNLSVDYKTLSEALAYSDTMTGEQVQILLESNQDLFTRGVNSEGLMRGFLDNFTYMGYVGLNLAIVAVILLSYADRADKGTKEFLETLPVKRVALELYNYVALVGIFLANSLGAFVIHLIYFGNYNGKIVALAERFPEMAGQMVPGNLVAANAGSLLYQFGMMTLFFITMITFLYMCMSVFKNGVAGFFVGEILWHTMSSLLYSIKSRWLWMKGIDSWDIPESFRQVVAVFDPKLYFSRFQWNGAECTNVFTPYVASVLSIMLVVMIGVLIAHAYCRELSKGKIFYVNVLNTVLLVLGGFRLFMGVLDWVGYSPRAVIWAMAITVIAEVVVITFLYRKKAKTYKLAVKEMRKVWNPLLSQRLRSFLFAMGVIAVVPICVDWDWNMSSLYYWINDSMSWFPDEPWYLNYFAVYYRYQYAMLIVAGFIVFKCIQFAMERTKARREFYETLPMSRLRTYCTKLLMDLSVIAVPLAIFTAVSIGHFLTIRNKLLWAYPEIEIVDMVGEQFLAAFFVFCVAVFFLGVMYLADAVTVNGVLKSIFCGVAALLGLTISIVILESNEINILYDFVAVIGGAFTVPAVLVYLFIGICLMVVAGYLYVRRDAAKEIFYYKAAKYVFAAMISLSYLVFVSAAAYTAQELYQYFLAVIGAVLIYFLTIYYCTPGKIAELQKKFERKKQVKKNESGI